MNKPNKHAELIKAWADGAEIEVLRSDGDWHVIDPSWSPNETYRIMPEPKPDYFEYLVMMSDSWITWSSFLGNTHNKDQIKITRDGQTHKIKSVELMS